MTSAPLEGFARYAIYYAPETDEPLGAFGRSWLGIEPASGETVEQVAHGLDAGFAHRITVEARRYGFHGTLKAPFRLMPGRSADDLAVALRDFCASAAPTMTGPLRMERIGPFLALTPTGDQAALVELASGLVTRFDPFRAPVSPAERERRLAAGLSPMQQAYFEAWGYPYVFEEFRFHLTLTQALPPDELARVERALEEPLTEVLATPFRATSACLFGDPGEGQPFRLVRRFRLGGPAT